MKYHFPSGRCDSVVAVAGFGGRGQSARNGISSRCRFQAFPLAAMLALVFAMLPSAAAMAAGKIGGVEVSVLPLPNQDNRSGTMYGTRHGYVEYRVQLKNTSTRDRVVRLRYPDPGDDWNTYGVLSTRTVPIVAGQEVVVSLYEPNVGATHDRMQVSVEGVQKPLVIPVMSLHGWYYNYDSPGSGEVAVLLSRTVPQEFRDRTIVKPETAESETEPATVALAPGVMSAPTSEPLEDRFAFLRSELPVNQWSPNWLGYSCFDAIVMTEQEAEEMPSQVRLAVRRYLECGGTLLIHGQKVPAAFSQGGAADGKGGYSVGFGHVAASLDDGQTGWEVTYKKLTSMPIHVHRPEEKPDRLWDLLVAETTVPIRGLFVLVLLFGMGIGPANVWLLSRYKRRIWLWWNVPAISLLTCLIVFGYSLASEGVVGQGKTASLTFLDERCHRATTLGYVSYYCPLTPSEGPRFGVDTDVALLENNPNAWGGYSPPGSSHGLRLVDWTNDQHLTSGWVNARVPTYFQIRKNEDRRERLSVEKTADGAVKVVNALGANVRWLRLADSSGHVYEGRDIAAGAEKTLTAVSESTDGSTAPHAFLRNVFASHDSLSVLAQYDKDKVTAENLAPGCYVAFLDKSPFVDPPMPGVESKDSLAIVYGISKGRDDGR